MLCFFPTEQRQELEMDFEQVHNFYERVVFEEVARRSVAEYAHFTPEMLCDVACVTLNQLPVRYVRHDVDLMFYLSQQERLDDAKALEEALKFAFALVQQRAAKNRGA